VSTGQFSWKKDMPSIAAAHRIPYVATACPSYPIDLIDKVKKGLEVDGPAYVHILSVCPTGWRCPPEETIKLGRLAVEAGIFPLYEVENGKYKMSYTPDKLRPIQDYIKSQRRFRHLSVDMIMGIQQRLRDEYYQLLEKAQ
jgi:pyruvate ferredoxin oxidoreductase beta subunit